MGRRKITGDRDFLRAVGQRVQELRNRHGWNQATLATKLGVEPTTISRFETGARSIPLGLLPLLADTLGVSCSELVDVERPAKPSERVPDEEALLSQLRGLDTRLREAFVDILAALPRKADP